MRWVVVAAVLIFTVWMFMYTPKEPYNSNDETI